MFCYLLITTILIISTNSLPLNETKNSSTTSTTATLITTSDIKKVNVTVAVTTKATTEKKTALITTPKTTSPPSNTLSSISTTTKTTMQNTVSITNVTESSNSSTKNNQISSDKFQTCKSSENVCKNNGRCFQDIGNPNEKFCRCQEEYVGLLCETKGSTGMDKLVLALGVVSGVLLLILIFLVCILQNKFGKDTKEKNKLASELHRIQKEHNKLKRKIEIHKGNMSDTSSLAGSTASSEYPLFSDNRNSLDTLPSIEVENKAFTDDEIKPLRRRPLSAAPTIDIPRKLSAPSNMAVNDKGYIPGSTINSTPFLTVPKPVKKRRPRSAEAEDLRVVASMNYYLDPKNKTRSLENINRINRNQTHININDFKRQRSKSEENVSNHRLYNSPAPNRKPKGIFAMQQERLNETSFY